MAKIGSYLPLIEKLQETYHQATLAEYELQNYHLTEKEINSEAIEKANLKKIATANFELDTIYNKINNISNK